MSTEGQKLLPTVIDHVAYENDSVTYLQGKAEACQAVLLAVDPQDFQRVNQLRDALFGIGVDAQKSYWQLNNNLTYPLQKMTDECNQGQAVSDLLDKLHRLIAALKPPKKSRPSLKERFFLLFSFRETAWQMWLDNYQTVKEKIGMLVKQLEASQQQLKRDNQMAALDQKKLLHAEQLLRHDCDLVQMLAATIRLELSDDKAINQARYKMVDQEFLDPLIKRDIELQQQLLIARQAVLTLDLIIKHNETMIRQIEQAVITSTAVLDVTAGLLLVTNKQQKLHNQLAADQSKRTVSTDALNHARTIINKALYEIESASQLNSKVENSIEKG